MGPDARIERLARETIGAAIEAHRHLGPGYLESVHEAALSVELAIRHIACERQAGVEVAYEGVMVGESRLDLLVEGTSIVELETVDSLLPIHEAQLLSYLKALNQSPGLLLNFKVEALRQGIHPVILSE